MYLDPCVTLSLVMLVVGFGLWRLLAGRAGEDEVDHDDAEPTQVEPLAEEDRADPVLTYETPEPEPAGPGRLPPGVRVPGPGERLAVLRRYPDRFRADLDRAYLLSAGVWCAADGGLNVLGTAGLGEVTLSVPEGDLRRAAQLLAEHDAEARRELTTCPACGYDLRATPDRCPECGLAFA